MTHENITRDKEILFSGILFLAMAYGISRFSFGLLLPYFNEPLHMTQQVSGMISSVASLAYCIGLLSIFIVLHKFQPKTMLLLAGGLCIIGLSMMLFAEHYVMFGIGNTLNGLAAGIATVPFGPIIKEKVTYGFQDLTSTWMNIGTGLGIIITGSIVWLLDGRWRSTYFICIVICIFILYINYKKLPTVEKDKLDYNIHIKSVFSYHKIIVSTLLLGMCTSAYWTYFQSYIYQTDYRDWTSAAWIVLGIGGLFGGGSARAMHIFGLPLSHAATCVLLGIANILLVLSDHIILMGLSTFIFGFTYIFALGIYSLWGARIYTTYPSMAVIITFITLAAGQFLGTFVSGFLLNLAGFFWLFIIYGIFSFVTILFRPWREELEEP